MGAQALVAIPGPVATVETDAAGRFSLAGPGAGIWRVAVRREGFVPMRFFVLPAMAGRDDRRAGPPTWESQEVPVRPKHVS